MIKRKKYEGAKVVYFIFVGIAILELIAAILSVVFASTEAARDIGISNIFLAVLVIILFSIPWAIERRFKVDIPNYLEVIITIFLFCSIVLGNIHNFLVTVTGYDKFLHTVSGIFIAVIGYEFIHVWNEYRNNSVKMGPGMMSIFAFTFTITLLVLWEFYEFLVDTISYNFNANTDRNMQRYQWINDSTVYPQPYGLMDTMLDLIVGAIGALVVSLIGWRFLIYKHKKNVRN